MIHSGECNAQQAREQSEIAAWNEKWPDACDNCLGRGAFTSGGSFYEPPSGEPCSECSENGLCARCMKPGLTSEDRGDATTGEGPCKFCGWNYDNADPVLAVDGPCPCELESMRADELSFSRAGSSDGGGNG